MTAEDMDGVRMVAERWDIFSKNCGPLTVNELASLRRFALDRAPQVGSGRVEKSRIKGLTDRRENDVYWEQSSLQPVATGLSY